MLCLIYARGSSYMRENREKQKKLPLTSVFTLSLGKAKAQALPSAFRLALSKAGALLSACDRALGKAFVFAECLLFDTRQS